MSLPSLTKEKEKLILDAAQHRFSRFGYSKVTMDEIAEDIGLAKASLYYYYPAKEYIFRSVIRREQEEFLRQIAQILATHSLASQKLIAYVRHRIPFGNQLSNLSALDTKLWQDAKPAFKELFKTFAQEELMILTSILREGKQSGELDVSSPEKTAETLLHVLQGLRLRFMRSSQLRGEDKTQFDEFEKQVELLMETLLHGLVKRNEP